jgi:tetratricopeptide (TPR) repeat protein
MISIKALALAPVLLLAACSRDPALVHREAGDELLARSDFRGAAAEYAKSIALDPKQANVWERLAFCRVKMGEKDLAAEGLVKLADLKPESAQKAEVFRNAAGIYLQGPEQGKAERYLVEAVKLDPKDEASLTWLGELASEKGGARLDMATAVPAELDKALGLYDRLIALRPEGGAAYANRRIVCVKYLGWLADERSREEARLRRGGKDAADARERIARMEAKSAELRRIYDESNAKLASLKKAAPK